MRLLILRQIAQPYVRGLYGAMLALPFVPGYAVAVFFHQCAEEHVIIQPCLLFSAKLRESRLPIFAWLGGEIREGFFEQTPFQFFDGRIPHRAVAQLRKIGPCQRRLEIVAC